LRFRTLLLAGALLAFGGALWVPFQADDLALIAEAAAGGWQAALQHPDPLTHLTFVAQSGVAQAAPAPWPFHLVNLLLHLACVWMAALALEELLPRRAAEVAAAVFAVHPLQTEAVVYIAARGILLGSLFSFLALWLWWKERRWLAALAFLLALAASPATAALPLVLLLLEWSTRRSPRSLGPALLMGAAGLAAALRTAPNALGRFDYFAYQGVAILRYLWLLLAPLGFNIQPDVRVAPLYAALAWGVLTAVVLLSWRTVRAAQPGFWLLAGLLLLVPTSSVFPSSQLAAEHRMYLPLVAFAALFGQLLARADWRLLSAYVGILLVVAFTQTRVWHSAQSLWMEAARQSPALVRPKLELARVSPARQAVVLLEEARRLAPEDPRVAAGLGLTYQRLGQRGLAQAELERALARDGCLFDAYRGLKQLGLQRAPAGACHWRPEELELWRSTSAP